MRGLLVGRKVYAEVAAARKRLSAEGNLVSIPELISSAVKLYMDENGLEKDSAVDLPVDKKKKNK